ncbi:hypothetical protein [Aquisalinus flavus]|nr:hypothetical protein [Aquisalinus flavus]MBD0428011.1 hypothetical protein [Aquisalinus flavus]UNE47763.1 hypothetical protein FF099_06700 [Aquisalinus flavus]
MFRTRLSTAPATQGYLSGFRVLSKKASAIPMALAAFFFLLPVNAAAQSVTNESMPDENTLARLVWSTMITLDDANETGNYAVLHQSGAPEFVRSQSPEKLAGLFSELRGRNVDLSRTLSISPSWDMPPAINEAGYLRLRGGFEFRPRAVRFDILFRLSEGDWKILGLSVVEMDASPVPQ